MSLYVTSINSGSNGNCYYVSNEEEAVLIDAGISCRETEKRMRRLGLSMDKVKAIFISHEHGDHIRGVESMVAKYQLPIYITQPTLQHSRLRVGHVAVGFRAYEAVKIGGLSVVAFPKLHDASDPHSFVVSGNGVNVGVFTDIGAACGHLIDNFELCHAVFLEANYDEMMLERGRYPYHLKRRISGGHGHLSNRQALDLFLQHRPAHLSHVFLSHLSKDNNCPKLALELFGAHAGKTLVAVASRDEEMAVYRIVNEGAGATLQPISRRVKSVQMTMFS